MAALEVDMSRRNVGFGLGALLLVGLVAWPVAAAEEPTAHATNQRTVILGATAILPSSLEMTKDESVAFDNYALYPLSVTFIEPAEGQAERIRCELVTSKPGQKPKMPWGVFGWNSRKQLEGQIAPGRFASLCSLAPGDYTYLVKRIGGASPGASTADQKGTIRVK